MICPKCGNKLQKKQNMCTNCGANLTVYKKIIHYSNAYYNRGLERAGVRDLQGAAEALKKSLDMNKRNTDARNLLGLVYYEMGEVVAALGEWVISKHFQPQDNLADSFMEKIQSNPAKLDSMNQAIKKYNLALESARNGGDDLAILQLKKVMNLNPHFLRAGQLLALLYLKNDERQRAEKLIKKLLLIDTNNTTLLKYQKELNRDLREQEETGDFSVADGVSGPTRKASGYSEDKPNIIAWVALVLGAVLGVLVTFFLIVPTAKKNIRMEYEKERLDYDSEMRIKEATIHSLEMESGLWKDKYEEAEKTLLGIEIPEYDEHMYDSLFSALVKYKQLLQKEEPTLAECTAVAQAIKEVEPDRLQNQEARALYEAVRTDVYALVAEPSYNEGRVKFSEDDYKEARDLLYNAYQYGYVTDYCYYYLAKSYQLLSDYEPAIMYYNLLKTEFPDSSLIKYVDNRLREMGQE